MVVVVQRVYMAAAVELVGMGAEVLFALSGPVIPVHSRQLVQVIHDGTLHSNP
jgi:hypothetical protein